MREPAAFAELYTRYELTVLHFFRRRVHDPEQCADLAAETFAAALEAAERFDPARGTAAGWLLGIAQNVLLASWKDRRVQAGARERLRMQVVVLTDDHLRSIAEMAAADRIDGLADLERDAVALRVLEDMSYADLAQALECSEQVARQRVSRGLRRLRILSQKEKAT